MLGNCVIITSYLRELNKEVLQLLIRQLFQHSGWKVAHLLVGKFTVQELQSNLPLQQQSRRIWQSLNTLFLKWILSVNDDSYYPTLADLCVLPWQQVVENCDSINSVTQICNLCQSWIVRTWINHAQQPTENLSTKRYLIHPCVTG